MPALKFWSVCKRQSEARRRGWAAFCEAWRLANNDWEQVKIDRLVRMSKRYYRIAAGKPCFDTKQGA